MTILDAAPYRERRKEPTSRSETSNDKSSEARSGSKRPKRLEDQMARITKELTELKKGKHQRTRKNPLGEMNAPFSRRVREVELPPKFKMPAKKYACSKDPGIKPRPKDLVLLQYVIQERGESLKSYVENYHKEEAYDKALKQVDIDEPLWIKVEHDKARSTLHHKKEAQKPALDKRIQNQPSNRSTYRPPLISTYRKRYPAKRTPPRATPPLREVARVDGKEEGYSHYTTLNAPRETIYLAICNKGLLRKPGPMKASADRRNHYKYCNFHDDVGYNTSKYYNLRNQIEALVRGGLLVEFLQQVRDGIKEGRQV
ncbi:hypothetical protein LWI28_016375 [Acer negundo]|uniref:Uncharacterized protein n=1 Tax=Acer negundo TaxID=4023 RepID=A0AAD5JJX5_ACENE|nr:hypothetical protein LWI28_016375 [Acer negundo]